jgi:hypothetical protein
MKRITRTYNDHVTHRPERVWLDQTGHWTHAELESIENKPQENGDAM